MEREMKERKKSGKEHGINPAEFAEKRRQSQASLLKYGAIMLIFALTLVLISYLTQLREARNELSSAQQQQSELSVSAMKTVGELREENERLKQETEQQRAQIKLLDRELDLLRSEEIQRSNDAADTKVALKNSQNTVEALLGLRNIVDLFNRGRYAECREAVELFEESNLKKYLPEEAGDSRYSPLDQYKRVYDALY